MSYQSPIALIMTDLGLQTEGAILKAVQKVGVTVDKDELMKALRYDRDQYEKGYADRDAEIVRCKDCWKREAYNCGFEDDFFCSDGERR